MSPLEARIIAYAIAAICVIGGSAWCSYTLTSHHYERLAAADRRAQDVAIQASKDQSIADLQHQAAATVAAEKQYEALKATSDGLAQQLASSVSNYAALHRGLLSATTTAAALADATRQGAQRDSELASLVRQAVAASSDDAATLTALQTWARGQ